MKKKIFITFLVIAALTYTVNAQSNREDNRFQFELSIKQNSAANMYMVQILNTDNEIMASQNERVTYYLAATQIKDLNRWFGFRYGVSLSDHGYREDLTVINFIDGRIEMEESSKNIRMHYLGAPLSMTFNLKNNKRLISGFAEAGISPELLLNYTRSNYMSYDLNRFALSGFANVGFKVNFRNHYSLVISPGVRYAISRYDSEPEQPFRIRDFRPLSANLTMGFQF